MQRERMLVIDDEVFRRSVTRIAEQASSSFAGSFTSIIRRS
jgi:hypothetical protein